MNQEHQRVIKGLKKGNTVSITDAHGSFTGVVQKLTDMLLIVSLLNPMTSAQSHSYHWDEGEFKSILFERVIKIKNLNITSGKEAA